MTEILRTASGIFGGLAVLFAQFGPTEVPPVAAALCATFAIQIGIFAITAGRGN